MPSFSGTNLNQPQQRPASAKVRGAYVVSPKTPPISSFSRSAFGSSSSSGSPSSPAAPRSPATSRSSTGLARSGGESPAGSSPGGRGANPTPPSSPLCTPTISHNFSRPYFRDSFIGKKALFKRDQSGTDLRRTQSLSGIPSSSLPLKRSSLPSPASQKQEETTVKSPPPPSVQEKAEGELADELKSPVTPQAKGGSMAKLPLFNDFAFSPSHLRWLVRKHVLRCVLSYVRAMGYPVVELEDDEEEYAVPPLILPQEEALRWLAEQEYVVGCVLLVCAYTLGDKKSSSSSSVEIREPALQVGSHPIRYAANYILTSFPQWGDVSTFATMWNWQVNLVCEVACEQRQLDAVVRNPHTGEQVVFSSKCESGNLARVAPMVVNSTVVYQMWVHSDPSAEKKLWFRFTVRGCPEGVPLCIRIVNLSAHEKLYCQNDMKPSWLAYPVHTQWRTIPGTKFGVTPDGGGQLSFYVVPPKGFHELHFSYCVPYSYGDLLCYISQWHALVRKRPSNVRFEERVLCRTWDHRKLHLLIISGQSETCRWSASNYGAIHQRLVGQPPFTDFSTGKKVILISGRVHPGEVTASHAVHGIITFLLSSDPRAELLREYFIFFVVPMLNPDGVSRGHTRLDQKGNNLNDCYRESQGVNAPPTITAIKTVFSHLQSHFNSRFIMFMDFHSHVSKDRSFIFGNHLASTVHCWNLLFPKLISVHTPLFSFGTSRFGQDYMHTKEGSARVQFGEALIHSYTVELTPFSSGELDTANDNPGVLKESADVGRACLFALLDYCCITNSQALQDVDGGWDALYKECKNSKK